MLKLLFLLSLAITIILTALQITGFQILDLIIIMFIIDFLSLGAYLEVEKRKTDQESKEFINTKLGTIEKVCNDIFTHITSPNPGIEAKIEKQRDDISYILDKIAKKSLELEERLNSFGQVLANSLKEKIHVEEKTEEKEEPTREESFSVGEIVYMEDEDKQ